MMVLVSNQTGWVDDLVLRYPWRIGHLYSPDGWRNPRPGIPYALDNGAFTAYRRGLPFDADGFRAMLDKSAAASVPAMWVLAPDVVADRERTLAAWHEWLPTLRAFGRPIAFAVQDGMTEPDVPPEADTVFVGGSTAWKLRTMRTWAGTFRHVHVARVNDRRRLWQAHNAGAESTDGTGWWHAEQRETLEQYLAQTDRDPRATGSPQQALAI